MKKLILLLILLPALCWGMNPYIAGIVRSSESDYLFYWDCETTTAKTKTGTVSGVVNSDAVLSTDQSYAGSYSLKYSTSYDYYSFSDSSVCNPNKGTITIYLYGRTSDLGANISLLKVASDGADQLIIKTYDTDTINATFNFTTGNAYCIANSSVLNGSAWNKCVFTWDNSSGSTVWSWTINGSAAGNGSDTDTWDSGSSVTNVEVGNDSGYTPTVAVYIDEIKIEE